MRWTSFLMVFLIQSTFAYFSKSFSGFLLKNYGQPSLRVLTRPDFGKQGSTGGDMRSNSTALSVTTARRPVIIVHGVTNSIGTFNFVKEHLSKNNYTDDEIYGTTYGDGWKKLLVFVKIECQYIKQVRALIVAVHEFTGKKVDILAYSMGSPVARKAILGGDCKGEFVGMPLTDVVENFIGIAGANYGSYLCFVPIAICNAEDGLYCKSRLLNELNTQTRKYEGKHSYAIFSKDDNKVGYDCCGTNCSSIPHSDAEFVFSKGWDHDAVMRETLGLQTELLLKDQE